MQNSDYWRKLESVSNSSILWNIPEQKTGRIAILGGNLQNCMIAIKNTEFLNSLPIKSANLLLPDALQGKLPTFSSLYFAESTESGSLALLLWKILRLIPILCFSPETFPKIPLLKLQSPIPSKNSTQNKLPSFPVTLST